MTIAPDAGPATKSVPPGEPPTYVLARQLDARLRSDAPFGLITTSDAPKPSGEVGQPVVASSSYVKLCTGWLSESTSAISSPLLLRFSAPYVPRILIDVPYRAWNATASFTTTPYSPGCRIVLNDPPAVIVIGMPSVKRLPAR